MNTLFHCRYPSCCFTIGVVTTVVDDCNIIKDPPSDQLSSIDIDLADVADALHHLNTSKAPGTDGVYPLILKVCSESISVPIPILFLYLINESMKSCSLPDEWKVHKIVPVPKTSDLSRVQNYRPISLLCILSKVLESIVYSKIIDFIRPQISNFQFGFLSNRSCLTQLLSSFSYIFSSIESKHPCDVVFLDFVKAFDTIPHQELLFKLMYENEDKSWVRQERLLRKPNWKFEI